MAMLEDVTAMVRDLGEGEQARLKELLESGALAALTLAAITQADLPTTVGLVAEFIRGVLRSEDGIEKMMKSGQKALKDIKAKKEGV